MNYFIKRDLQEFGPYTLSELQRYVASGNVLLTDLCRSEALSEWVPVSQVIGNIPVPAAAPAPTPASAAAAAAALYPSPPSLHWGIAVLLGVLTCGLFGWVWAIVQANWVRKVQPTSKALVMWSIAVLLFLIEIILGALHDDTAKALGIVLRLGGAILWIAASFNMRSSLEEHYNTAEPIGLDLNGVMTFFFNVYYFQYHFTRINEIRRSQGVMA
jgi:GYF domain 2/Domain of unknown function (DUF4234)